MKKSTQKSMLTGVGIAMALGGGAMLLSSAAKNKPMNMVSMKKNAEKAIKNIGSFLEM